jgi:hypothetical protein
MASLRHRRLRGASLLAVTIAAFAPPRAIAQRPELPTPVARVAPSLFAPAAPQVRLDSVVIPPTHWREGAIIGGALLGLVTAVGALELCGFDAPCHNPGFYFLGGLAGGGIVGFGLGALIGGQFPKHSTNGPPPSM